MLCMSHSHSLKLGGRHSYVWMHYRLCFLKMSFQHVFLTLLNNMTLLCARYSGKGSFSVMEGNSLMAEDKAHLRRKIFMA